jgi:sodium/bile acid cotransporter 7
MTSAAPSRTARRRPPPIIRRIAAAFEPFILALLGTVLLASLAPPRGPWAAVAGAVANGGIFLLFFLHGAKLSPQAVLEGARNLKLHLAVLAATYLLFPLFGLALAALPILSRPTAVGLLFLTLLPSTVQSSIAFTAIARGNVAAAVCAASFSNLIGIVLTPALTVLLIHGKGGSLSLGSLQAIVVQLLLPFAAGQLMRPRIGGLLARHKAVFALVDRGSILLVVYAAFGAAVAGGIWSRLAASDLALVAGLCLVLLAAVLGATWALARGLGLGRADGIALLFCGSKKSLASGVPMAGVLFPGPQAGLIILPLILFHQLQLIACAVIARRFAESAEGDVG